MRPFIRHFWIHITYAWPVAASAQSRYPSSPRPVVPCPVVPCPDVPVSVSRTQPSSVPCPTVPCIRVPVPVPYPRWECGSRTAGRTRPGSRPAGRSRWRSATEVQWPPRAAHRWSIYPRRACLGRDGSGGGGGQRCSWRVSDYHQSSLTCLIIVIAVFHIHTETGEMVQLKTSMQQKIKKQFKAVKKSVYYNSLATALQTCTQQHTAQKQQHEQNHIFCSIAK